MKKLILFEGTDGSGKTTLINNFKRHVEDNGMSCQVLNKENVEVAFKITEVYKNETVGGDTEIYLRIAREFAKIDSINTDFDFVIIDRALISLISTIKIYGLDLNSYSDVISKLLKAYPKYYTVFCAPPFEIARKRIEERALATGKALSKKEAKGFEYNKKIYDILTELADDDSIKGQGILKIDSHLNNEEGCLNEMINYFLK